MTALRSPYPLSPECSFTYLHANGLPAGLIGRPTAAPTNLDEAGRQRWEHGYRLGRSLLGQFKHPDFRADAAGYEAGLAGRPAMPPVLWSGFEATAWLRGHTYGATAREYRRHLEGADMEAA